MKPHEFSARDIREEGPSLPPEFLQRVLEPQVAVCPQQGQVDELLKTATHEDLLAVVADLRVRLRVTTERNLELCAAIRRLNREVFP